MTNPRQPTHGEPLGGGTPLDVRLYAPATQRNRHPILAVLERVLPRDGLVLELASGSGEHAIWFAQRLRPLRWQPSDPDAAMLRSIAAHANDAGCASLLPPLALDASADDWPITAADAVVCINLLHIAPWSAAQGLMAGAARILPEGGVLYLYGPYRRAGVTTAPSNEAFDASLRAQNPDWGLRDLEAVEELAAERGLALTEVVEMPANNLSLVFVRTAVNSAR